MTEIRSVPASQFPAVYPLIEPFMRRLERRTSGGVTVEDMSLRILRGDLFLLVPVKDGRPVGFINVSIAPNGVLTVLHSAGDNADDWANAAMDAIEAEFSAVEVIGRPGWWRKCMKARGYRISGYIMERRSNEQK